jgi:hypothetical protein
VKFRRISGVVAVVGLTLGIPFLWAQNLGDVAREDRERRSRLSSHSPVLTNDDLGRERILTPELKSRILRTQAGTGAVAPQDVTTLAPAAEEQVPPGTLDRIRQIRRTAGLQRLTIEALQPASVAAQALPLRTLAYNEPAVAVPAAVDEPVSLGEYQVRSAAVPPPSIEAISPAAVSAYMLPSQAPSYTEPAVGSTAAVDEPGSLGEYARQLRAYRVPNVTVQPLDAGTAEITVTTHGPEIPLGEFARELRASRLDLQAPDIAAAESPVASREEEISLGEYARQLRLRFTAEPLIVHSPAAQESAPEGGQPLSLGEFARQLRAVRVVPAYESASITPLPPRTAVKAVEPEISLGEYARQLRMRRAAEEYMRLLAQDDPSIAAALPRAALAPIRYRAVRVTAAPAQRQSRVPAVAAKKLIATAKNEAAAGQERIAVTVRRGDSLWKLARVFMGSGARWQSISFVKKHRGSPNLIRAGEVVLIPVSDRQRARGTEFAKRFRGGRIR